MTRLLLLLTILSFFGCASRDYDHSDCLDVATKKANQLGLATNATWINEELAQCLERKQGRTPRQPAP